jgi:hypothetical protein
MEAPRIAIFLIVLLAVVSAQEAGSGNKSLPDNAQELGSICVLPNSPDPPMRLSPGGEYNPATLTLRIDKREPIRWPHKQAVKIENLTLNDRHVIVLTSDGERIQSFWFRFSDFKYTKLCVYFDGYQGVQLADRHSALWCKCR